MMETPSQALMELENIRRRLDVLTAYVAHRSPDEPRLCSGSLLTPLYESLWQLEAFEEAMAKDD